MHGHPRYRLAASPAQMAGAKCRRRARKQARDRRQNRARNALLHHLFEVVRRQDRADDPQSLIDRKQFALGDGHDLPRRRMPHETFTRLPWLSNAPLRVHITSSASGGTNSAHPENGNHVLRDNSPSMRRRRSEGKRLSVGTCSKFLSFPSVAFEGRLADTGGITWLEK